MYNALVEVTMLWEGYTTILSYFSALPAVYLILAVAYFQSGIFFISARKLASSVPLFFTHSPSSSKKSLSYFFKAAS